MARGVAHSDETKAAVMAALLAGQGVTEVAEQYKLNEATVRNWKRGMPAGALTEVNAKKENEIEGKILTYLSASLDALAAQSRVASDENYLRKYPPQQLAVLHGVMADKSIRILEALQGPAQDPDNHDDSDDDPD